MSFTLTITVASIEEAEAIVASLRRDPLAKRLKEARPTPNAGRVVFPARHRTKVPKELREALSAVQAKYGVADLAKPLAILARFGSGKLDDLAPTDYPAFIAACAEA